MMVVDPYRYAMTPTVSLTASDSSGSNALTYTFTDKAIGTASATRLVVVGVALFDAISNSIASVTIGGTAATETVQSVAGVTVMGLFQRVVSSGTTATIVVTAAGTASACGIAVWVIDNYSSSTATDTDSATGSDPMTDLLNISAGGVAVAIAGAFDGVSASWAGLTEDTDSDIEAGLIVTAASGSFVTAQTNLTIGPDFSGGSNSNQTIAMAAWR